MSASFGLAAVASTKFPLSHALAAAEAACKAAKDRGRGRVELYQEADRSIVRRYEDVAIIGNLREAILNDRFRMDAQPIVELAHAGGARRFELLLRMIDASGESVAPDKFLTAAERGNEIAHRRGREAKAHALEVFYRADRLLGGVHVAGLVREEHRAILSSAADVDELIGRLEAWAPNPTPKWRGELS